MLDLRYCKRCNQIYKYGNGGLCSVCLKDYEEIMAKVRVYLEENPRSGVMEVARDLNESEKDILFLLREGRLSIRDEGHHCYRCGKNIETGRYCKECIRDMKSELRTVTESLKNGTNSSKKRTPGRGEMYTLYRHKDE